MAKGCRGDEEGAIFHALRDDFCRWAQNGVWYAPTEGAVSFERKAVTIQSSTLQTRLPLPRSSKPLIASGSRMKVGEAVAITAAERMQQLPRLAPSDAWVALTWHLGKRALRQRLVDWFCWQCLSIPDCSCIHASIHFAEPATRHADPDATAIDVGPCADFYDDRLVVRHF